MGGIILYLCTLALELISVIVRFALVAGLVGLMLGRQVGVAVGAVAALYPVLYSLAALAGIPRGHLLTRLQVRGRRPTPAEQARLDAALALPRDRGIPIPRHIFVVDREGVNAFISGRALYIYCELFEHEDLAAVLAHELGHHNSLDGRLSGAIFSLTLPGGFLFTYMLLAVLKYVAYGALMLLIGLFVIVFLLMGLNTWGFLRGLFGLTITFTRFAIIFAVGGVGTALLGSLWRAYFVTREYAADAYAARLGYASGLIHFFEHEVLSDMVIPWYTQPTHPPTTRRIEALEAMGDKGQGAQGAGGTKDEGQGGQGAGGTRDKGQGGQGAGGTRGASWERLLLPLTVVAGVLAVLLLATALLIGDDRPVGSPPNPALTAPTPTLAIPTGN